MHGWVLVSVVGVAYAALQLRTLAWPDGGWRSAADLALATLVAALGALVAGIAFNRPEAPVALVVALPLAVAYLWSLTALRLVCLGVARPVPVRIRD